MIFTASFRSFLLFSLFAPCANLRVKTRRARGGSLKQTTFECLKKFNGQHLSKAINFNRPDFRLPLTTLLLTCADTIPSFSRRRSVCDHELVDQGEIPRRSSPNRNSRSWFFTNFLMFHGKSLCLRTRKRAQSKKHESDFRWGHAKGKTSRRKNV